jgi:hypothetical protein
MIGSREVAREPAPGSEFIGLAIGILGAFGISIAMIPLRDDLPNACMALALVLPVLGAAIVGGRWAGGISAVVAALSFNFWFTKPYLSLRISSSDDVVTFVELFVVAMIAAELALRARRGGQAARESRDEIERLYRVAQISAQGGTDQDVVDAVCHELVALFELEGCAFEGTAGAFELPRLGARGALEGTELVITGRDFELPTGGVEIPVLGRGQSLGRLVLSARPRTPAPIEKRLVAIALADELGMTLAARAV